MGKQDAAGRRTGLAHRGRAATKRDPQSLRHIISNTATISSPTTDPNPDNNSATAMNKAFNPPPTIVCPANVTAVTALPGDMSVAQEHRKGFDQAHQSRNHVPAQGS